MAKRSPKSPGSLRTAFEPDAWRKFESLIEAASSKEQPPKTGPAPKQRKGLRSGPLRGKTQLKRKSPLTRKT
jgi:hypothetical protein